MVLILTCNLSWILLPFIVQMIVRIVSIMRIQLIFYYFLIFIWKIFNYNQLFHPFYRIWPTFSKTCILFNFWYAWMYVCFKFKVRFRGYFSKRQRFNKSTIFVYSFVHHHLPFLLCTLLPIFFFLFFLELRDDQTQEKETWMMEKTTIHSTYHCKNV